MNILKRLVHMYYGLMFYFKYRTAYNMQTKKYTPNQKEFIKSFNEVKNICLTSENFNTLVSEKLTLLLNNPTDIGIIHSFVGIMGGVFVNNCLKLTIPELSKYGCEKLHYFTLSLFNSMETQQQFFLLMFITNRLMMIFQNEYMVWVLADNSVPSEGE